MKIDFEQNKDVKKQNENQESKKLNFFQKGIFLKYFLKILRTPF